MDLGLVLGGWVLLRVPGRMVVVVMVLTARELNSISAGGHMRKGNMGVIARGFAPRKRPAV